MTMKTPPNAAIGTGVTGQNRATGSLATSSVHGSRVGHGASTNGSGKNAPVWSIDRPAVGSTKPTAAGSTGTTGWANSGSLATISMRQTV